MSFLDNHPAWREDDLSVGFRCEVVDAPLHPAPVIPVTEHTRVRHAAGLGHDWAWDRTARQTTVEWPVARRLALVEALKVPHVEWYRRGGIVGVGTAAGGWVLRDFAGRP